MSREHQPHISKKTMDQSAPERPRETQITLYQYNAASFEEEKFITPASLFRRIEERGEGCVNWIVVTGFGNPEVLQQVGEYFNLHPLALEDVMHGVERPKTEDYDSYLFLVLQQPELTPTSHVRFQQMSLFLGAKFLVTFVETPNDEVFGPILNRLQSQRGLGRTRGHDYLAYSIIDGVVDHFFPVLEPLGEAIEQLEEELLKRPSQGCLRRLHTLKRALLSLRRNSWPLREVVGSLTREESGLVKRETGIFLRDCYDHAIQIMDVIESYRDLATGMMDIYLSSVGLRTNEIMRVLTLVSTIFIPLTFIVGVYGMNFKNMPELDWRYGYPAVMGLMMALAGGMLYIFWRKRWL